MELEIKSLSHNYKKISAISNMDVIISDGITGILGANGAGKTTLMKILCNLINTQQGEILYDGTSISKLGVSYYDILGYLPQKSGYYSDFTVQEHLNYICKLKGLSHQKSKSKIDELLEVMNLTNKIDEKFKNLSGGMKQRVGIVQTFLNDPKLIVLDEPTAGLDPYERLVFRNYLSDICLNKIILISTHIVSDIENIADTVLIMNYGKLVKSSTPEDVIKSVENFFWDCIVSVEDMPKFKKLYPILHSKKIGENIAIRFISEKPPKEHSAVNSVVSLEDAYLYYSLNRKKEVQK